MFLHNPPFFKGYILNSKNRILVQGVFLNKNVSEMTVKEFLEEAKKKGTDEVITDPNYGLLQVLLNEGFSENEANQLKMKKAWDLYLDSIINSSSQMFTQLFRGLEESPEKASVLEPYFEKMREQLEDMIKDLENQEQTD